VPCPGRMSIAGLACYRAGERSRLFYRTMLHRGRKGEKEGFRESDFAALLDAAHQQLAGPIVLVWDNLHGLVSVAMRALIAAGPGCACTPSRPTHPNSTRSKSVWSHLKRSLANAAAGTINGVARLAKTRLKKMQYTRPRRRVPPQRDRTLTPMITQTPTIQGV
jgi:hypothetical protein